MHNALNCFLNIYRLDFCLFPQNTLDQSIPFFFSFGGWPRAFEEITKESGIFGSFFLKCFYVPYLLNYITTETQILTFFSPFFSHNFSYEQVMERNICLHPLRVLQLICYQQISLCCLTLNWSSAIPWFDLTCLFKDFTNSILLKTIRLLVIYIN